MNTKVYRQYDSRWGSKPYPTSNSTVSSDGCGLVAVTHCQIEQSKYTSATPLTFYSYMKGYAVAGNGTRWDGIDAGLKAFGLRQVKRIDNMPAFWAEVSKGNRVGVILFRSGSAPDGTLWTTGGHYVAFTDYKYQNGKHWLYTKDSGFRCHDGWYSYEDSMRGRIALLWTASVPIGEDGKFYGESVRRMQKWLGTYADGVLSNQLTNCKKYLSNIAPACSFSSTASGGSAAVRALQKVVGATVDGYMGKNTVIALQKYLNNKGFNCGTPDGYFGEKTALAFQRFLNSI